MNNTLRHHKTKEENGSSEIKLLLCAIVIGCFMVLEAVGGVISGSLALLSEAGHMLSDFLTLLFAWGAVKMSRKEETAEKTFGYHRLQIVAAFTNSTSLFLIAIMISIEAATRFYKEVNVDWGIMMPIAIAGTVVNCVVLIVLKHGIRRKNCKPSEALGKGGEEKNLNLDSAVLHILGDLLGSVAAIIAAVIIKYTGWMLADPITSVFVSLIILHTAFRLTRESLHILLEGTPHHVEYYAIEASLKKKLPEVLDVHDMHAWSLSEDFALITLHLVVTEKCNSSRYNDIILTAKKILKDFGITHSTIEIESGTGNCADAKLLRLISAGH